MNGNDPQETAPATPKAGHDRDGPAAVETELGGIMPAIGPTALRWVADRRQRRELSAASAAKYRGTLLRFAADIGMNTPIGDVRRRDVEEWLAGIHVEAATLRNYRAMLGVFFRWCVITGYTRKDPTLGVPVPRVPRAVPRRVHRDACTAIFAACTNPREELMVALCLNEGLRVGEVARVELGDIDWHAKTMTVHGKGGHERLVPITAATWRKIVAHSDGRGRAGPLLRSQQPGREYLPISPRRVSVLVSAVMRRAGVAETGHGLRHTAAAETLESGATIRQVQVMLGHASVQTTTRYLGPVDAEGLRRYMDARGVDTT